MFCLGSLQAESGDWSTQPAVEELRPKSSPVHSSPSFGVSALFLAGIRERTVWGAEAEVS